MPAAARKLDKKIAETALRLAASRGWQGVTLERIAKAAGIPSARIKARYADRNAILPVLVDYVSAKAAGVSGKSDRASPPRDRLFEAAMARFDVLQAHRKAILSIAADSRTAVILASAQIRVMKNILERAGLARKSGDANLKAIALWGIYLAAFRVWCGDETLDMSKTMAALDRYLHCADKAVILFRANQL
jgi:AcrR family transcriptional regulator